MAAAVDLFACVHEDVVLEPGSAATLIPAGFAMHIANPYVMALIAPRSGMGHKKGLILGNTVGVIDADYTGQIFVSASIGALPLGYLVVRTSWIGFRGRGATPADRPAC